MNDDVKSDLFPYQSFYVFIQHYMTIFPSLLLSQPPRISEWLNTLNRLVVILLLIIGCFERMIAYDLPDFVTL